MPRRQLAGADYRLLRSTHKTLTILRVALALHAGVYNVMRDGNLARMAVASAVMLGWSLFLVWHHRHARIRERTLLVAEFILTLALVLLSPIIIGDSTMTTPVVTVYWHIVSPLALAVAVGVRTGVVSALIIGLGTFLQHPSLQPESWSTSFIMVVIAWGVGSVVQQLRVTIDQRDDTLARAAVLAERDRMARIVHDGALQVLSLVEREAPTLGPRGVRLAKLALNQEVQLRAALQDRRVPMVGDVLPDDTESVDLAPMIEAHGSDRVTVSLMAGSVMLPRGKAIEIEAAVQQVLLNVARHAGPEAHAWVLVEETDDSILISIRDNGIGMERDRLASILASNRMGMRESIIGRIDALGGQADVKTQPSRGLEWELRIPAS